jgi:hypothetical protein
MAQAYNPSYSGGKNQEDYSSKPAQPNSLWDPISKKTFHFKKKKKKAGGLAQGVGPQFKPQYRKINK